VAELHSTSRSNGHNQLTGRSADCLFFLLHAGFQGFKSKKIQAFKMFKRLLILSVVIALGTSEFRFGGVSVIPNAIFFKKMDKKAIRLAYRETIFNKTCDQT
jgi:hypothetical protein